MSDNLEGDNYITLHMVWPIYSKLFEILAETNSDFEGELDGKYPISSNMKRLGREYMNKNKSDFSPTFQHKVMTLLTPTMKKLTFIDFRSRVKFQADVEDYISANLQVNQNEDGSSTTTNVSYVSNSLHQSNFLDGFISLDTESETICESELTRYLNHPITCNVDTKDWWCENAEKYPSLFRIFLKLSCVPATSASSERDFSIAGNIVTDKRSLILPDNVNNLIVMRNRL